MFATVVIPTYNRRKVLERTLDELNHQTAGRDTFEVVVVNDNSSDDTRQYLKSALNRMPNLICIHHGENQGRVATRNDGIHAARGDIVIFLDDDNVPEREFVEGHLRGHEQCGDRHIVLMGNARFTPEIVAGGNFARYLQSRYLGCRSPRDREGLDYGNLPPRCLGTLNCSVRRSDLLAVGLLDPSFRHYGGEDEDLGYRLSRLGIRIVFGEGARSWHYDDVSLARTKLKLMESARFGLRILVDKSPEYVESTQIRFLLPIDWRKDSLKRIILKLSVLGLLNPVVISSVERWAALTDGIDWLYFQPLYRLLSAAWILRGYRSRSPSMRFVSYSEDSRVQ